MNCRSLLLFLDNTKYITFSIKTGELYLLKALSLKRVFPPQGTRDENMSIVIKLRPLPFILKLNKIINKSTLSSSGPGLGQVRVKRDKLNNLDLSYTIYLVYSRFLPTSRNHQKFSYGLRKSFYMSQEMSRVVLVEVHSELQTQ